MPEERIPVIIDTDPGDDDAVAILWVLANPRFDVKACTVGYGNSGTQKCVCNMLRILEVAGRTDIPVYAGAYRPLLGRAENAAWIHGEDGLGDAGFPLPDAQPAPGYAPVEMIRHAKESKEPVTLLCLSPVTNVALAYLLDPTFKDHVREVLIMGGAVRVPGNANPGASANLKNDPWAAQIVYRSGMRVVQLGLDTCNKMTELDEDWAALEAAQTPVTDFIIRMLRFRREQAVRVITDQAGNVRRLSQAEEMPDHAGGIGLNDVAATAYLIEPNWFKTREVYIDIDADSLCPGRTVPDLHGLWGKAPNARLAYEVDGRAAVDRLMADLIAFCPVDGRVY